MEFDKTKKEKEKETGKKMNGGMTECDRCDCDPCRCAEIGSKEERKRIKEGREVAEVGIDVFSKVKFYRWRMRLVRWLWPDLQRLTDALYNYWDKS